MVIACVQMRLKILFLQWLNDWEENVKSRKEFTPAQQNMMMLSRETREGLKMAGVAMYMCKIVTCLYHSSVFS